jgi:hypothetical protein
VKIVGMVRAKTRPGIGPELTFETSPIKMREVEESGLPAENAEAPL